MIKIEPFYVEKVWAGNEINKRFSTSKKSIGEAWVVSAYKDRESILESGESLSSFYKKNKSLFGDYPSDLFPLLIKFIDAKEPLSIQVHPNNSVAQKLENYPFGKAESWYILHTKTNSIIAGTNSKSLKDLRNAITHKQWATVGATIHIKKGDFVNIDSGTIHAITKGTFLYEIQQSCDITYHIYDYDRMVNGEIRRPLHMEKVIQSSSINNNIKPQTHQLTQSTKQLIKGIYSLAEVNLKETEQLKIPSKYFAVATNVSHNAISIMNNDTILKLEPWESCFIFNNELNITIKGQGIVLLAWI